MKWIPITGIKDLPKESGPVLVTYREPDECIGPVDTVYFSKDDFQFGKLNSDDNWYEITNVIAWAPTPAAYKFV